MFLGLSWYTNRILYVPLNEMNNKKMLILKPVTVPMAMIIAWSPKPDQVQPITGPYEVYTKTTVVRWLPGKDKEYEKYTFY